jgi:NAD-dependent DNA ligase
MNHIERKLDNYRESYFNGEPEIEDAEYDALVRYYEKETGKKYSKNGAEPKGKKVNLPYYMGSVDAKFKGDDAQKKLDAFAKKYPGPWVVSSKLDGNAGQYVINNDDKFLYSKGDGLVGENMSEVLGFLDLPVPEEDVVVRGELILPKKEFEEYAKRRKEETNDKNKLTSVRSAGSGILKREGDYDLSIVQHFKFITFQVQSETLSTLDHYERLKEMGFETPWYVVVDHLEVEELEQLLKELEETSEYEVDGLVISPANDAYQYPPDENPKHLVAFKVDKCFVTKVISVEWNVTPKNQLIPLIQFEPVMMSGANCSSAKGHNAKFILDNKIGPGSEVLVTRAGNIIPQVVKCLTPSDDLQLPEGDYEWDATKTHFLSVDETDEVRIAKMVHFAKNMKIDGLSSGRMKLFYEQGIDTIEKLLDASVEDMASCPRVGRKTATTIRENINLRIQNADLVNVMVASNVFGIGFGELKLGKIVSAYPDILDYVDDAEGTVEKLLLDLGGFSKMAKTFEDKLPLFVEWLEEHPQIVLTEPFDDKRSNSSEEEKNLKGEVVVFTGFTDDKLVRNIVKRGGEHRKAVSKRTTILVAKNPSKVSGKREKMNSTGRIVSLEDFIREYGIFV